MSFWQELLRIFDTSMETPQPYGWFHLLWCALTVLAAVALCLLYKKGIVRNVRTVVLITAVIVTVLEVYKQINYTFSYEDGIKANFQWYAFPWQFCSMPMYVGLLAGCSDLSFDPADHRFINRHNYTVEEVEQEVQRPIVQKILSMLRLRNTHPAFDGELEIGDTADDKLLFTRRVGEEVVSLEADLQDYSMTIRYTEDGKVRTM